LELIGVSEIAELAGVSRQAVFNWQARHSSFPAPVAELRSGPVWRREDIEQWLMAKEGKMAKVVSFINLKGGVGKTTICIAMSEFLAVEHDKRVLVVDLDPQTNATTALIQQTEWKKRDQSGQTIRQLFEDSLRKTSVFDIQKAIIRGVSNLRGGIPNLSLLPSSLGLIEIQDQLALIPGGNFYAVSPVSLLKKALKPVLTEYDYILIDCPPNLGIITLNGIGISKGFVIPTIPDILSTYGLPQILNRIEDFNTNAGTSAVPMGIIIAKYRAQSGLHNSKVRQLRGDANNGKLPPIFDTVVPEAAQVAESADFTASVKTLKQKYGYGNNYTVFSNLAGEFLSRC